MYEVSVENSDYGRFSVLYFDKTKLCKIQFCSLQHKTLISYILDTPQEFCCPDCTEGVNSALYS